MRLFLTLLATATTSYAAMCTPKGLVGLGDSEKTYPPDYTFALYARNSQGDLLPLVYNSTAAMAPLTLGVGGLGPPQQTKYELTNGAVRTFNKPYRYISTASPVHLGSAPLFASLEGSGMQAALVANNVSCDGLVANAIRWSALGTGVSTGSGSVKGPFGTGAVVSSPVLDPLLPIDPSNAIDLYLIFI